MRKSVVIIASIAGLALAFGGGMAYQKAQSPSVEDVSAAVATNAFVRGVDRGFCAMAPEDTRCQVVGYSLTITPQSDDSSIEPAVYAVMGNNILNGDGVIVDRFPAACTGFPAGPDDNTLGADCDINRQQQYHMATLPR